MHHLLHIGHSFNTSSHFHLNTPLNNRLHFNKELCRCWPIVQMLQFIWITQLQDNSLEHMSEEGVLNDNGSTAQPATQPVNTEEPNTS